MWKVGKERDKQQQKTTKKQWLDNVTSVGHTEKGRQPCCVSLASGEEIGELNVTEKCDGQPKSSHIQ